MREIQEITMGQDKDRGKFKTPMGMYCVVLYGVLYHTYMILQVPTDCRGTCDEHGGRGESVALNAVCTLDIQHISGSRESPYFVYKYGVPIGNGCTGIKHMRMNSVLVLVQVLARRFIYLSL